MTKTVITEDTKALLEEFLHENRPAELIDTYLFFIENKFNLQPILFPKYKVIFQSVESAVRSNPQDAIYDWVSKCQENTEGVGGLRVKRFFVSEDPDVIMSYIGKGKLKDPITKVVYSSVLSGKLFNSKDAVIKDFRRNYLKKLSLIEVQSQNRFQIEETFLEFIQEQLVEEKITSFVEAMAEIKEFEPIVEHWLS